MAQLLSAVTPGTLVKLNENGSPVEFYVAAQNYESGLNGAGRTLLVRKDAYKNEQWNASNVTTYANSTIDQWFNGTYKNLLDPWVKTAIGTTTFYYTPGGGNNTVTTLGRSVFALSLTELGVTIQLSNNEGQSLSISSTLKIAYLNGEAVDQWTRSPRNDGANYIFALQSSGGNSSYGPTSLFGFRPCFTLPNNLYVEDNGNVITGPAPTSITTPYLIFQNNSVPISWDSVSGADSYILQRKADSGEWTQVYAGVGTTFTDTAGSWSTVQYQVCGVFNGLNGAFAPSDVITVVPASTLVISGEDRNLGTITNDIPYAVSTDTGNQISLTRTVNGALVASLTVNSGFAYNIPVMDLPTGTNTIVITATVTASTGPVTVKRTWTYTKQAVQFPGSGGVAQLAKDGQNVFPMTLAEAVKAIGGPWGGNLSTALDKLARAATYSKTPIPKYTEIKVGLSKAKAGDIVNLPENGVMVPFYVASLDYEPTMNSGIGTRVLLVRKDVYQNGQWNASGVNTYAGSTIDTWFNSTYKPMLDSKVLAKIGETTFYYTPGNGNNEVTTLKRAVFALSGTELGLSNSGANKEGNTVPVSSMLFNTGELQWTRTPGNNITTGVWALEPGDSFYTYGSNDTNIKYRPCFTLPATFRATYYVDTAGNVYPSQEYTTAGDFYDLWGNVIPSVKIATGSYKGTGTYGSGNPNNIALPFKAQLIFIGIAGNTTGDLGILYNSGNTVIDWAKGLYIDFPDGTSVSNIPGLGIRCVFNENATSWYSRASAEAQLNLSGVIYKFLAIG